MRRRGSPDSGGSRRVETNNAEAAPDVLSGEGRAQIEATDAHHAGVLLVELRPGQLTVRTREMGEDVARLERVGAADAAVDCQVCGGPMEADVVRCAECATPHHRACWTYLGRCSTYACGSRRAQ